jgi:hypothetical protein
MQLIQMILGKRNETGKKRKEDRAKTRDKKTKNSQIK